MKTIYLPKTILKDNRLTPATKLVAHHLFHISGWEDDNTLPSSRQIEKSLGITNKTASTALNILKELEYIQTKEDNTFKFLINGCNFTKKDLANKELCNLVGDFVVVPTFALYCDLMTAAERDVYIKFFDFYFGIKENTFYIKKDRICIKSVSTYYNDNERSFRKHIQNIKTKGLLDYKSVNDTNETKIMLGVKAFVAEKKWVIYNEEYKNEKRETKEITAEEIEEDTVEYKAISDEEIQELVKQLPNFRLREYEYYYKADDKHTQYEWLKYVIHLHKVNSQKN